MGFFLRSHCLSIFLLFSAHAAEARVFNITEEKVASYLLFNAGTSAIAKTAFENESTGGVSYSSGYTSSLGGEFGFIYSTPVLSLRFGIGMITPTKLKDVMASNGSGDLYTVNSDLLGFVPKVGLEINLNKGTSYRIYAVGSVGTANLTMKNQYVLTVAGQAAYAGVTDHTVESKGTASEYYGGAGAEIHTSDSTTFVVELGYRSLKFSKLTYAKDVTTFTGAQTSGSTVLDVDGNERSLNFSGILGTVGIRIYL